MYNVVDNIGVGGGGGGYNVLNIFLMFNIVEENDFLNKSFKNYLVPSSYFSL